MNPISELIHRFHLMRHDLSDLRSLILIQIIPKERTQKVRFSLKYRRTAHTGRMIKYEVLNNTDV